VRIEPPTALQRARVCRALLLCGSPRAAQHESRAGRQHLDAVMICIGHELGHVSFLDQRRRQLAHAVNHIVFACAADLHRLPVQPERVFHRAAPAVPRHDVQLRALLGEPSGVLAQGHRVSRSVAGESLVAAQYQFDGATASIEVGWKESALTQGSLLAIGDEGEAWFEGTLTRGGATRFRLVHGRSVVLDETRDAMADYNESFYLLQKEFTAALAGTGSITQTPAEHLATLRAVFAAYRSMESGALEAA
jgi:hypothetical protein